MNRKNGDFLSYDEKYMRLAMQLAGNAIGRTSPNPLVGTVIVKDNRVVGCGWHRKAGTPHAEVHALNQAGELAQGADVYVTLEPCSMCAGAIINSRIKKVYYGTSDNKTGAVGSVLNLFEDFTFNHKVEYEKNIMQTECENILKQFFKELRKNKNV